MERNLLECLMQKIDAPKMSPTSSENENVAEVLTNSEPTFPQQVNGLLFSKLEDALPDRNIFDEALAKNGQRHPSQMLVERPMFAKSTRLRSFEGRISDKSAVRQTEKEWSPYFAGDEVYRICGVGALTSYPRPIPMSSNGILEASSLTDTVGFTPMRYL